MTPKKRTGNWGEALAADYLRANGWRIAETNYRHGRQEVDLVAWDTDTLVFLEVKTRAASRLSPTANALGRAQQRRIATAAQAYMESIDYDWEIRFDLIAITDYGDRKPPNIEHIKDAWFPGLW